MNPPVRLGVSLTPATLTGFYSQRFWGFRCLHWTPGQCGLSCSPVVCLSLSACECGTTWFASCGLTHPVCHLATRPLHLGCLPPPLILVWMNVSSLTPWLSDFYTVWFFWQFWLFFAFKFVDVFLVVWGSKMYLPTPPSWPGIVSFASLKIWFFFKSEMIYKSITENYF